MKKLIALAFSDLHLNLWKQFNQDENRTLNTFDVLRVMANEAKAKSVPVLFAGDLFHNPKAIANKLLHLFIKNYQATFEKNDVQLYGIDGNHDQCENNTYSNRSPSYFETFSGVFKTMKHCNNRVIETPNFLLYGIPYFKDNDGMAQMLKEFRPFLSGAKPNILMIHTDLYYAEDSLGRTIDHVDNMPRRMKKFFQGFDLVLDGHIHKPNSIFKNIRILGAPQQQSRADEGVEMGYWKIYDDMSMGFKPLDQYPKFISIEEGQKQPDSFNYYTVIPKEIKEATKSNIPHTTSKKDLIKAYCQSNNIKSKARYNLIMELIQKSDD